jgi:hypothetical protein
MSSPSLRFAIVPFGRAQAKSPADNQIGWIEELLS